MRVRLKVFLSLSLLAIGLFAATTPAQEQARVRQTPDASLLAAAKARAAQRMRVPASTLLVVNTSPIAAQGDGRPGYAVKIIDPGSGATHQVRFDGTGQPEDEMRPRRRQSLRRQRIDSLLARELEAAGASASVPIAVWLRDAEQDAETSSGRPIPTEARRRLRSAATRQAFLDRVRERRARRVNSLAAPLLERLRTRGVSLETGDVSPVLFGSVRGADVHEIASWPEVVGVFADHINEPELPIARRATKAHTVHSRRITGQDVKIAQIEAQGGRVSPSNPYLTGIVQDETAVCSSVTEHSTWIAGIIRSTHDDKDLPVSELVRGFAPGATLWAGGSCSGATTELNDASRRAVEWGASVLNLSWGYDIGLTPGWADRYYDDLALNQHVLVVKSAGNRASNACGATDGHVTSPGLAYNVLTVGAFNDGGTFTATGDAMDECSSHVDPSSMHNDRQKPELVAPGYRIQTTTVADPWIWPDGGPAPSGTSFSSPMVAGAAALLIQRDPALAVWPEGLRAILMATATQNIEGAMRLSDKDGAGAISLEKADDTAARRTSRDGRVTADWDGFEYACNRWTPTGEVMTTTLPLLEGRRVRAVIAWNTDPNYENYELEPSADLDLQLIGPSGAIVATSSSFDNTYEIVDHVPSVTGTYTLRITLARCDLSPRYVGWAWWGAQ